MHIPLAFGLVGADGRELPVSRVEGAEAKDGVLSLRKRRHVIRFLDVAEQPVASLNRGFSAPVTISGEQSTAALAFLARHDGDLFGRWQALNTIETEALVAGFRRWRAGKPFAFADRHRRPGRRRRRRRPSWSRHSAPRRSPCPARPTSPARSPPISIRTACSWRARR